jgi:hypothetical protein
MHLQGAPRGRENLFFFDIELAQAGQLRAKLLQDGIGITTLLFQ